MCGGREFTPIGEGKKVDFSPRQVTIWAVKARYLAMDAQSVLALRVSCQMTQRQFADLVGVDPITVSRWERGITAPERPMVTHIRAVTDEYKRRGR